MSPRSKAKHQLRSSRNGLNVARLKVLGVGGAGGNAVNHMIQARLQGVEFLVANTDLQALEQSKAAHKLQLGAKLTKGLGSGANPEVGRRAALEDTEKLVGALEGADMVFITAGLGGGTGTGAAPVIASLASELGALTVAVVTKPFAFEGKRRMLQAEQGLAELLPCVDTLICIPNQRLLDAVKPGTSFFEAFRIADDVLRQAVQGITDIITVPGVINRDFADVETIVRGMGYAVMGTAVASGPERATEAARRAMASPLLEEGSIKGARGVLINVTGSSNLGLDEVEEASSMVQKVAHEDANIIFGAVQDRALKGAIKITVIATGFKGAPPTVGAKATTPEPLPREAPRPSSLRARVVELSRMTEGRIPTRPVRILPAPESNGRGSKAHPPTRLTPPLTHPSPRLSNAMALERRGEGLEGEGARSRTQAGSPTGGVLDSPVDRGDLEIPTFLRQRLWGKAAAAGKSALADKRPARR
jgi:cell division protein FtsZ